MGNDVEMAESGPPDEPQGPTPDEPELPPWPQMARPTWHNQPPYGQAGQGGGSLGPQAGRGCLVLACVLLLLLAVLSALVWLYLAR